VISRVIRHPLVRLLLQFLGVLAAVVLLQVAFKFPFLVDGGAVIKGLALAVLVVGSCAAYAGLVSLMERRPVSELSFSGAPLELLGGILVGGALLGSAIGAMWMAGCATITVGTSVWSALGGALMMSISSGVTEELLFRGVIFRNLEDLLGTWFALAISAVIFGLIHISNPHSSLWAAAAIAIEAGVLLGAAYVLTRRLWIVMGIHFAWNFTQGGLFGVAVSGTTVPGMLSTTLSGPDLLSGGQFGMEASIVCVVICTAAGIAFAWRAYRLGHFLAPRWRRPNLSTRPSVPDTAQSADLA
jgi:uncharacterized protein